MPTGALQITDLQPADKHIILGFYPLISSSNSFNIYVYVLIVIESQSDPDQLADISAS